MNEPPLPPFSFPWNIVMGLKEEITSAGYRPDTMGPTIIIAIKTTHTPEVFKFIALPVSNLK